MLDDEVLSFLAACKTFQKLTIQASFHIDLICTQAGGRRGSWLKVEVISSIQMWATIAIVWGKSVTTPLQPLPLQVSVRKSNLTGRKYLGSNNRFPLEYENISSSRWTESFRCLLNFIKAWMWKNNCSRYIFYEWQIIYFLCVVFLNVSRIDFFFF